jgi:peroxiredoxin Q/BCP
MRPAFAVSFSMAMIVASLAHAQDPTRTNQPAPSQTNPSTTTSPRGKEAVSGLVTIGERAPDFELDASTGKSVKLSSLRGDWVILAFSERRRSLLSLNDVKDDLEHLGGRVVGVVHDKQQTTMSAAARDKVPMLFLSDATGEVSSLYGLFSWARREITPGFFVLDRDGVVRLAVIGRVLPPDQMVQVLDLLLGSPSSQK